MIGSFVLGLPFGIKGVAWSLSITLLCALPWILTFTFRNTNLTLSRLFEALVRPVALSLSGAFLAELALRLFAPEDEISQLLMTALCFLVTYSLSILIPSVREEFESFKKVLAELRSFRKAV